MLPTIHIRRGLAGAVRVNAAEVEFLLLQGWRLADEHNDALDIPALLCRGGPTCFVTRKTAPNPFSSGGS